MFKLWLKLLYLCTYWSIFKHTTCFSVHVLYLKNNLYEINIVISLQKQSQIMFISSYKSNADKPKTSIKWHKFLVLWWSRYSQYESLGESCSGAIMFSLQYLHASAWNIHIGEYTIADVLTHHNIYRYINMWILITSHSLPFINMYHMPSLMLCRHRSSTISRLDRLNYFNKYLYAYMLQA